MIFAARNMYFKRNVLICCLYSEMHRESNLNSKNRLYEIIIIWNTASFAQNDLSKRCPTANHTWVPWCNSQRCHAFRMKWSLFLKAVLYLLQRKSMRGLRPCPIRKSRRSSGRPWPSGKRVHTNLSRPRVPCPVRKPGLSRKPGLPRGTARGRRREHF